MDRGGPGDVGADPPPQPGNGPREALPAPSRGGAAALPWLLVLVLAAGVALGVVAVGGRLPEPAAAPAPTASPSASTSVAQRPTPDPLVEREAALVALLRQRAAALLARDSVGWAAAVDQTSVEFAARQSALLTNIAAVPIATWEYEYAGPGAEVSSQRRAVLGADAWVARVILVYRLAEADSADVRREMYLTVVRRDGRWLLADDTAPGFPDAAVSGSPLSGMTSADVWDLGPVAVVRGARSLVLGTGDLASLQVYADQADSSAVRVDEVWGAAWPRVVVIVVPGDQAQMARLLQRPDEVGLEQIAAVTTGEVGLGSGQSADRVIVNPAGFDQLDAVSRGIVLTHEITHVATRATSAGDVPIWLSEGFADYVAYSGTELPKRSVAADVLDLVRAGTGPTALPDTAAFDPVNGSIAPAYSGAWLAADLVAGTYGEEALTTFYRTVAGDGTAGQGTGEGRSGLVPVEEAFRTVLGTDQAAFVQQWQAYLAELAQ